MSLTHHRCNLPIKDIPGLSQPPPTATWKDKLWSNLRKLVLISPNHFRCRKLFRNKSIVLTEKRRQAISPYCYVIHPLSSLNVILEGMFFIVWFYCLICEPLTYFMNNFRSDFKLVQLYVILPVQLLLIALFFNVGYIDKKSGKVILQPRKIIWKYLTTYFVFDFMTTYTLQILMSTLYHYGILRPDEVFFPVIYILRILCCCVRIGTLMNFIDDTLAALKVSKKLRVLTVYTIKTSIYLHIFTFFLYLISKTFQMEELSVKSWLYQANINQNTDVYYTYFESFLMVTCYFFGLSYKYNVNLLNEEICVIVISFFGWMYSVFLLADILTVLGVVGASKALYKNNLLSLQQYMAVNNLPESLRRKMLRYYKVKFRRHYLEDNDIINRISDNIRKEMFLFGARKLIQKAEIFKKLPSSTLGAILGAMISETYSPKDIIIKIGSEVDEIYFISSGTVAVMNRCGLEVCHLEDGDEFGTSCLVFKEQIYAIVAADITEVFIISKSRLMKFLYPHPTVMSQFCNSAKVKLDRLRDLEDKVGT